MSNYSALEHMLDHCLAIEQFMNDFECKNVEDFIMNRILHDAVVMNLLAIGELTTHMSDDFKASSRDKIDWRSLKQLRNIIAHRYGAIQFEIIWNIINDILPDIKSFCSEQIKTMSSESEDEGEDITPEI
ncbi:MAG: DUF86 domain-containing protein [Oscillospiraceae bacterium]|nr:DUF86 domain-containing protein [Oscillospiraceae bacterium]